MLKLKRISNALRSATGLVSGLICFCIIGGTALGQGEHAAGTDPPASAALEFDDTAESKANQPISILTQSSVRNPGDEAVATAREDSRLERARGARLLPPDPRRQTSSQFSEEPGNPPGVVGAETGSATAANGLSKLDTPNWLLRTLGGLGAVIALLFLLRPLLRRLAGPLGSARAPSGVLEALARYPFGKGQFLVLIKLDTRILLLCQTNQGSNLITEIRAPDEVASLLRRVHDEKGESFNRKLETLLNADRGGQPPEALTGTAVVGDGEPGGITSAAFGFGGTMSPANVIDLTGAGAAARPRRFQMPTWVRRFSTPAPPPLTTTTIEVK